jgi:hypothetical protein
LEIPGRLALALCHVARHLVGSAVCVIPVVCAGRSLARAVVALSAVLAVLGSLGPARCRTLGKVLLVLVVSLVIILHALSGPCCGNSRYAYQGRTYQDRGNESDLFE